MIILFILLILLIHIFLPSEKAILLGLSIDNPLGALSYPLVHISWLHLATNILSLSIIYRPIRTLYCRRFNISETRFICLLYLCSVIAGVFTATYTPTLGASGCVFALLGMLLLLNPTKRQTTQYIYVLLTIIVQIYFQRTNIALHILAFVLGALTVIIPSAKDYIDTHHDDRTNPAY